LGSPLPLIHNIPPDWKTTWNLSEQLKEIRARPTFLYDPTVNPMKAFGATNPMQMVISDPTTPARIATVVTGNADGVFGVNNPALVSATANYVRNMNAGYEVIRTPVTYKNNVCAAAPATTDIWAPTAGKKFRLLGGIITMGGLIAAAATRTLQLIEETAGTVILETGITIPVLGNNFSVPFNLGPNGYLSSTVTKKLQAVTAGATYTTGQDVVSVWGTEE
jgi:hypothetical protein